MYVSPEPPRAPCHNMRYQDSVRRENAKALLLPQQKGWD
jgi:hypothetical protein